MAPINRPPSTRGLDDVITEDGILCSIISRLPLREAVRTSVLSRRWRYLWTHTTKLVFNATNIFGPQSVGIRQMEKKDRFIRSVNSVLEHRQGLAKLDHFEVRYFFFESHWDQLDEWVRYAVASETKMLGFNLTRGFIPIDLYPFPFEFLRSSIIEELSIGHCSLYPPPKFDGLNHLKRLTLTAVVADDEDINCLLSNAPSLKTVIMFDCDLGSLSIPHPVSELQCLVVKECNSLSEIEMNAPKLIILEYEGLPVDFKFKQSSQLYDATISFETLCGMASLNSLLMRLASNLPHLHSLTFKIGGVTPEVIELPEVSNRFAHLKNLNCFWNDDDKMSLLHLASVLNVAPVLQVLTLHFKRAIEEQSEKLSSNLEEILSLCHCTHLKTIKITGFYFDQWQVDIVIHLLNIATELESMTIEKLGDISVDIHEADIQNLWQQVPANIKFVILKLPCLLCAAVTWNCFLF